MGAKRIYSFSGLLIILFFISLFSIENDSEIEFEELAKITLRDIGNKLLLSDEDATSLILPVIETDENQYKLSFQNELAIHPDTLVSIIEKSFKKGNMPKFYRVEVIQCKDEEVAYSYEIKDVEEASIIPCSGRALPKQCYTISVRFTDRKNSNSANSAIMISTFGGAMLLLFIGLKKSKNEVKPEHTDENAQPIGSYSYFVSQHKLVFNKVDIPLSRKECELLDILIRNLNTIVQREELVKRVWEDQGVFVSRSLDTYISKLRKKFKSDPAVQIINVHGIGYKLEVTK